MNTRTTHDRNEIVVDAECAYIILADRMGEEIGRVKIDIEDVDSRGGRTDKNGMRAVGFVIPPSPARLPAALGDRRGELFPTPGEFWTKGVRQ